MKQQIITDEFGRESLPKIITAFDLWETEEKEEKLFLINCGEEI